MFYTMESVKDQIEGKYSYRTQGDLPSTWTRYPCKIERQCEKQEKKSCNGYVEILLNLPHFSIALIEILFFRPRKIALIREENKQLRKLIENRIIDVNKLRPFSL